MGVRAFAVALGGGSQSNLGDTWTWDGAAWVRKPVFGPSTRLEQSMAYDSNRDRTVLFGGSDSSGNLGDTWEWNSSAWAQVSSSGPPARSVHAMCYDSIRNVVVLFGGSIGGTYQNDTWTWDGTTWTQVASTGPSIRGHHGMVFDSARGVAVLFGGFNGTSVLADTWEWNGASWTQVATTGPSARYSLAMAFDRGRGRTVLFGGSPGFGGASFGDTWEWDGTSWSQVASAGPVPRYRHAMAEIPGGIAMFGGFGVVGPATGEALTNDIWEWNGSAWSHLLKAGPSVRVGHAMAFDRTLGKDVLFGGQGDSGRSATDCDVLDSVFIECATQVIAPVNAEGFKIQRNLFKGVGQDAPAAWIDAELNTATDQAKNWIISDNIFDGRGSRSSAGSFIQLLSPTLRPVLAPGIIANNTFFANDVTGAGAVQQCIDVGSLIGVAIKDNQMYFAPAGIFLAACENCVVSDNHLTNCGGDGSATIGLFGCNHCVVQDNVACYDRLFIEFGNAPALFILEEPLNQGTFGVLATDHNLFTGNQLFNNPPPTALIAVNAARGQPLIEILGVNSRSYGNFIDGKPVDDAALLNTADLKAMPYPIHNSASFPTVKRFTRIAGWLSPGDGGGGIYYWDKDSSAADNGTTVLVPADYASQTNGRWLRQPQCALRVADGAIAANTLVKPSITAGRMSQFLVTDPPFLAVGVALDGAAMAGDKIRVVEVKGVLCQIKSDGTTNIAPQDLVEASTTVDGRIRKGSTAPIRIALSASIFALDELVEVL